MNLAEDFVPISLYLKSPFILVINPALPVHSVRDLIAYIKERPGQISYASSSIGGAPHLSTEYLKQRFDLDINHVPYKNSPQSIADRCRRPCVACICGSERLAALIKDGKLRAIAVTSLTRLPSLPDVPPLAEAAGGHGFEAVSWHVLFAKTGTPAAIVDKLHSEMTRIMSEPDLKKPSQITA
ncbi:tripartite tricarboxylate transporter substrate-binding protein [Bradyrhizobium sp. RDT10]